MQYPNLATYGAPFEAQEQPGWIGDRRDVKAVRGRSLKAGLRHGTGKPCVDALFAELRQMLLVTRSILALHVGVPTVEQDGEFSDQP
jgi:hypothetical protein